MPRMFSPSSGVHLRKTELFVHNLYTLNYSHLVMSLKTWQCTWQPSPMDISAGGFQYSTPYSWWVFWKLPVCVSSGLFCSVLKYWNQTVARNNGGGTDSRSDMCLIKIYNSICLYRLTCSSSQVRACPVVDSLCIPRAIFKGRITKIFQAVECWMQRPAYND